MLFKYTIIDESGQTQNGTIDAFDMDVAITSLQRRGMTLKSIVPSEQKSGLIRRSLSLFNRVKTADIVILSRQIATLFEAQVSALRIFRLLGEETPNPTLRAVLIEVASDLQSGSSISNALAKHPKVFSDFYVNMVTAGEESGKLDQTFAYLADYLDRTYEVSSRVRNALIYPAFVIVTFIIVMVLMLVFVIPKISAILMDSGQALPIYTVVVLDISNFFATYGLFLLVAIIVIGYFLFRYVRTDAGRLSYDRFKIQIPYLGGLYRKLYLARIADNLNTMILSGISMIRAVEITGRIVGNKVYENILTDAGIAIRGGASVAESFSKHPEVPGIMIQMMKVGEETGELGSILKTLAHFYDREVTTAVDTIVDLIEPVMVVVLGIGVGFLIVSVLMPIYNMTAAIQ